MSNQIRTSIKNKTGTVATGNQLLTATNGINNLGAVVDKP